MSVEGSPGPFEDAGVPPSKTSTPAVGIVDPDNSFTLSAWTGKSQRPIWRCGFHPERQISFHMTLAPPVTGTELLAHLYRRAAFGALPAELASANAAGYEGTVTRAGLRTVRA